MLYLHMIIRLVNSDYMLQINTHHHCIGELSIAALLYRFTTLLSLLNNFKFICASAGLVNTCAVCCVSPRLGDALHNGSSSLVTAVINSWSIRWPILSSNRRHSWNTWLYELRAFILWCHEQKATMNSMEIINSSDNTQNNEDISLKELIREHGLSTFTLEVG